MKYKVKQYILRSAPLILVCCMFVFVLSPSASAAGLDYNDYVSNIIVDGDNDIVTVSLPTSYAGWVAYQDLDELVGQGSGAEQWFSFSTYNQWQIICSFPSGGIDLSNIPNGTKVGFGVDLVIQRTSQMPYDQSYDEEISIIYLLKDGSYSYQRIGSTTKTISKYGQTYNINLTTVDYPLEIPDNADSMYLELKVRSHYGDVGSWTCKCTSNYFSMEMKISSLYRQQQLTGKTNKLLDETIKQLEEQGKTMEDVLDQQTQTNDKLDDIINGEVNPEAPEGADKVGDLDDAEGQLRDEAQVGLDQGVQIQQNVLQILEEYANGFAVFSWIFGLFAKLPFFSGLLYVSVALGTVSALLNLGLSAQAASDRANSRAQRNKKGG